MKKKLVENKRFFIALDVKLVSSKNLKGNLFIGEVSLYGWFLA